MKPALETLQETLADALRFANAPIQGGKLAELRRRIQKAGRECAAAIEERDLQGQQHPKGGIPSGVEPNSSHPSP